MVSLTIGTWTTKANNLKKKLALGHAGTNGGYWMRDRHGKNGKKEKKTYYGNEMILELWCWV